MAVKKITKRWLFNNLGVIFVILVALEIGFAFGIRAFYYNNVQAAILTQANIVTSQLTAYSEDSSVNFSTQVRSLVENFTERNHMELMAVDLDRKDVYKRQVHACRQPVCLPQLPEQVNENQVREIGQDQLFYFWLHSDSPLSLIFSLARCWVLAAAFCFRADRVFRIEGLSLIHI